MMINNIVYLILITCTLIFSFNLIIKFLSQHKRDFAIKNFSDYMVILEFFEEKAYDIIYKDQLLIYSLEATKIDDKQFEIISKDFTRLVLRIMGEPLQYEFTLIFGLDALFVNTIMYFNKRYEDDEIRKEAIDNLTNDSDEQYNPSNI